MMSTMVPTDMLRLPRLSLAVRRERQRWWVVPPSHLPGRRGGGG
jgi:hypothetical protein